MKCPKCKKEDIVCDIVQRKDRLFKMVPVKDDKEGVSTNIDLASYLDAVSVGIDNDLICIHCYECGYKFVDSDFNLFKVVKDSLEID